MQPAGHVQCDSVKSLAKVSTEVADEEADMVGLGLERNGEDDGGGEGGTLGKNWFQSQGVHQM